MARILVADDENDIVDLIKMALEKKGHVVSPIYSGEDVLPEMERNKYDLVILDVMMPYIDGYNIQMHMNEKENLKNIPVIVITALQPAKSLFEKFDQVKDFVVKPFEAADLIKKVENILEKKN